LIPKCGAWMVSIYHRHRKKNVNGKICLALEKLDISGVEKRVVVEWSIEI